MSVPPTLMAAVALLAWPLVGLWLFANLQASRALLWTILGGYLLLPVGAAIKFDGVPEFDKTAATALAALLGCLASGWRPPLIRRFGLVEVLVALFVLGPVVTSYLNDSPVMAGGRLLPGTGLYDGTSAAVGQLLLLIPFFLGRQLLGRSDDGEQVLRVLVVGGLLYSLPMLFEMRLSPQLHNWIYGYFQSSFATESRYGGFRAVVFLQNGLVLALFIATAVLAAVALWRTRRSVLGLPAPIPVAYLAGVLVLCKSAGALLIGMVLMPLVGFARPLLQARVALILVALALVYPTLRSVDLFPADGLVGLAGSLNAERAQSLQTRFSQEDMLLERASERYWFGWGRFGRARVYDETGKDISLTDGYWIIVMGSSGLVGFIAAFGLLAVPVVRAARSIPFAASEREAIHLAALTLIVAAIVVDQLPNASLSPWTWLITGALLGRAEALRAARHQGDSNLPVAVPAGRAAFGYNRAGARKGGTARSGSNRPGMATDA